MDGLRELNKQIDAKNKDEFYKTKGRIPLIRSLEEFISTDLEKDSNYNTIVQATPSLVQSQQELLFEHSTLPTQATTLLDTAMEQCHPIPTGILSVDMLLQGGIYPGEVTEILGAISTGKTQLLHLLAINCAHSLNAVLYIDNNCSFSARRAIRLWSKINSHSDETQSRTGENMLKNIHVISLYDPFLLLQMLRKLLINIQEKTSDFYFTLKLVIFDNFSYLLSQILDGYTVQGSVMYSQIEKTIKYIANVHNIAVVVANRTSPNFTSTDLNTFKYTRLGYHWNNVASTRILLERDTTQIATLETELRAKIKLFLIRSNLKQEKYETEFKIPITK
ncbi:DNA repair protein RAD51-like protein 4 isoform X1 [Oopsacas minuta]|uniref:DNA repair protein RAD51-like protein 4 isoform X1 n=1 Tax=Oopsacas minuta TaxID=111878 RepID=A0AAV7JTJ1_9METZ|nr:DNA repair protein RAD51-like protein 4 isoform X1 [Oopsacas minuta]